MTDLKRWRNAVFTVFLLMGFCMASWLSRVPHVRDILGASTDEMGLVLLGISLGSVTGLLAASHIIHRFGSDRVSAYGPLVVTTGFALAGWAAEAGAVPGIIIGFAIGGLMTGTTDVAMNITGAANERAIGKPLMPVFHAFFSVGTVLGAGFGTLCELAGINLGIQSTIVVALAVVVALVVRRSLPADVVDEEQPVTWKERLAVWKEPLTIILGIMVLGFALTEGSANDWLSLLMVDGHGFTKTGGAMMFALFLTAMTAGRLAGVPLLARFGRTPVLMVSAAIAAVGLLLVIFVDAPPLVVLGTLMWGMGAALGFPVGMSAAADDPRLGPARVATVSAIGYLAFLAGPPLLGLLGAHVGLRSAMLVVLAFVLVSLCTTRVTRERSTTPASE